MDSEQFQRFSVTAMPTIIVLDSAGNELFRKIGYFEPDIFIANLEQAGGKSSQETIMPILRPLKTD
jgi:thioredoxin-related protein